VHLDLGSRELGNLEMAISMNDDRVDLKILTASDRTRDLLAGELNRLRDALTVQNVQLGQVDVGVGGRQPGGHFQGQAFAGQGGFNGNAFGNGQGFRDGSFAERRNVRDDAVAGLRAAARQPLGAARPATALGRSYAPGFDQGLNQGYNQAGRLEVRA
jgi:flagellar hook-length control protein FliK